MKKVIIRKTMLLLVVTLMFFILNPVIGQAATLSDKYKNGIRVKLSSMGNINKLDFSLTGDYYINNTSILLTAGSSYQIVCNNGNVTLINNNQQIYSNPNGFAITPLKYDTFIKFIKESYMRSFSGSMTFYKNDISSFYVVNKLNFNDYLKGVVPYEEGDSFPAEALKAQAVAARTYAMYQMIGGAIFDVYDTTSSQVYRGYSSASIYSNAAVESTKGEVLTYGGNVIDAFFSSSNGGWTEQPQNAWYPNGSSLPYLPNVKLDTFDSKFKKTFTKADIITAIKNVANYSTLDIAAINKITFTNDSILTHFFNTATIYYNDSKGVENTLTMDKYQIRDTLGLISSIFNCTISSDGSYVFVNRYGHGLGMSQWGSYSRAKAGQSYKAILDFYFINKTYQNVNTPTQILSYNTRIGGSNRFDTANAIAQNVNSGMINDVLIATGLNYPDAIAAAPLAGKLGSPILIVDSKPTSIYSKGAIDYINTHLNKGGNVYIAGGTGVVSSSFETMFKASGFNVIRVSGLSRIDTSVAIAGKVGSSCKTVVITTANDYPDAVSISSIAAMYKWPILLTDAIGLSDAVKNYLAVNKPTKIYIVGGTGVISANVATQVKSITGYTPIRYGGIDRYATNQIVANAFIQNPNEIVISTGSNFPDALTASIYAAKNLGPVLLIDNKETASAYNYVKSIGANDAKSEFTIVGGSGVVSDTIKSYLLGIK